MNKKKLRAVTRGLVHVFCATAVVFAVGWMAVTWAERGNRPKDVKQGADGELILTAKDATIQGVGGARFESFSEGGNIGYWGKPSQSLEWKIKVRLAEKCRVIINYSLPAGMTTEFKIVAGKSELLATIEGKGNWATWQSVDVGELTIPEGDYSFKLIPVKQHQEEGVMNFERLVLKPVDE